jgi:nucleoside permease NupC
MIVPRRVLGGPGYQAPSDQVNIATVGYVLGMGTSNTNAAGKDANIIGSLMGTRLVLNELVAYSQLGPLKATLDPRSFTIATYALCGFANLSSIGIQIGGISSLAPERRADLARLGFRAWFDDCWRELVLG